MPCLMVEGAPDLERDLCKAIRIAQHEIDFALTQGGTDLQESCVLTQCVQGWHERSHCSLPSP